jgi:hypothetical protein
MNDNAYVPVSELRRGIETWEGYATQWEQDAKYHLMKLHAEDSASKASAQSCDARVVTYKVCIADLKFAMGIKSP